MGGADHSYPGTGSRRFTAGPHWPNKGGDLPTGALLRGDSPKTIHVKARPPAPQDQRLSQHQALGLAGWGGHQHLPEDIYQLPQKRAHPCPLTPRAQPSVGQRAPYQKGRPWGCFQLWKLREAPHPTGPQAQQLAPGKCLHPLPPGIHLGGGGRTTGGRQHGGHFGERDQEGPARGAQGEGRGGGKTQAKERSLVQGRPREEQAPEGMEGPCTARERCSGPASHKPALPGTCLGCTVSPPHSPAEAWLRGLGPGRWPGQPAGQGPGLGAGLLLQSVLRSVLSAPSLREACSCLDCGTTETPQNLGKRTPRGWTLQRLGLWGKPGLPSPPWGQFHDSPEQGAR